MGPAGAGDAAGEPGEYGESDQFHERRKQRRPECGWPETRAGTVIGVVLLAALLFFGVITLIVIGAKRAPATSVDARAEGRVLRGSHVESAPERTPDAPPQDPVPDAPSQGSVSGPWKA